ncbi:MAG TPA: hypothetical protein VEJ42_02585 [Streptosporangiaceae bacterium]|nr:hypothetical protein [Streptosporangiaceae bacterium]
MSSVFLYVAIVAIWLFVLVPRWLRRLHGQPRAHPVGVSDADPAEGYDDSEGDAAEYADYPTDQTAEPASAPPLRRAPGVGGPIPVSARSLPRSRMLQARRRLLTMLVLLTAAAAACTAARLTPSWTCAPPAGVLLGYFLLLRTAARADAEHSEQMAAIRAHEARLRAAARRAEAETAAAPGAEIIDISARVADQLYDQYADATVRAVGD